MVLVTILVRAHRCQAPTFLGPRSDRVGVHNASDNATSHSNVAAYQIALDRLHDLHAQGVARRAEDDV